MEKKNVWHASKGHFVKEWACLQCPFPESTHNDTKSDFKPPEPIKDTREGNESHIDTLRLIVEEAYTKDVGRGRARIDHHTMDLLGIEDPEVFGEPTYLIEIEGNRRTVAWCLPLHPSDESKGIIRMDGLIRHNAGVDTGDKITLRKVKASKAEKVIVSMLIPEDEDISRPKDIRFLSGMLDKIPIVRGDFVMVPYFTSRLFFRIVELIPSHEAVVVTQKSIFELIDSTEIHASTDKEKSAQKTKSVCSSCLNEIIFPSIFTCAYCGDDFCEEHRLVEHHNCIKTRYVKYIRKSWLRKKGQNVTSGKYMVVCDTCGFQSGSSYPIEIAGSELEDHLKTKGCDEKNIFLEQTNEDEFDKEVGIPLQSSESHQGWLYDCLEKAKEIIITHHLQNPTDERYLDCRSFFMAKTFEINIQNTNESAYAFIGLQDDYQSQDHYIVSIHENLFRDYTYSEDMSDTSRMYDNKRMVIVVLIHELLHALHPTLLHDVPMGINQLERLLANKAGYYDALRNMERFSHYGRMKFCSN
ncbi:MAG: hypothetical protein KGI25_03795 [Thaumarchaeota archaeon]|nr:hypothetical protein [Nitrososphaerota archaeon]